MSVALADSIREDPPGMALDDANPESRRERWNRILRDHGEGLSRVVTIYERDPSRQEDLFQEICFALWKALPSFRGDASERTFAFRIAHNRGLSHRWKRGRRREEELPAAEPPDPRPGPEHETAARQTRDRLINAVRSLPVGHRQVLALSLEGLSQSEIAAVIGITENNVAVRLHRARATLRERMEGSE